MMHNVAVLTSLIAALAAVQQPRDAVPAMLAADTTRTRALPRPDSLRTLRAVRRAQEQFESFRRANLPFLPGGRGGTCDLRIGRLCYWDDDGEPAKEVPEPERIARGRDRLLEVLGDAARQLPGDAWISGQRVRYLIDARRGAEAVSAASECASPTWWCAALMGLALHIDAQYARADSAFGKALASMPGEQRCEWTDISLLLDGQPAKRYRGLGCAEREGIERRFWWLSQPLYGTSGNDARTEFLARRTMSRLEAHARSPFNMSWGSDLEELLMRFGWSTWWTRDHPSSASLSAAPTVTGHGPTPSFFFHPSDRLLTGASVDARTEDWEPRSKRPVSRYAPAYAASFSDLRTRVAMFRRGDSSLVVAAYEYPADSLFRGAEAEVTLAVARDEVSPMIVVRRPASDRQTAPLVAKAPHGPLLVSVEVTAPRTRGVARARFGLHPPGPGPGAATSRLALSDLLLYEPADSVDSSLDAVARRALGALRLTAGGRVGVYWEIYGVRPAGEPLSITLAVERVGVAWHTRAAQRLRLASKVTPLKVRWQEVPARDAGFASRAITIDLSSLPPGRYRMHLTVAADDGSAATSERVIEIFPVR